jgi:hypothetical protein
VVIDTNAVLFPIDLHAPFTSLTYSIPATISGQLITGLTPSAGYEIAIQPVGNALEVTITPGGSFHADSGGVLSLGAFASVNYVTYLPLIRQ